MEVSLSDYSLVVDVLPNPCGILGPWAFGGRWRALIYASCVLAFFFFLVDNQ